MNCFHAHCNIVCKPPPSPVHSQSLSLALRNIFGRAEQLEVTSGTSFPLWGHNVQLQFTKPYYKNFDKKYVNLNPVCTALCQIIQFILLL